MKGYELAKELGLQWSELEVIAKSVGVAARHNTNLKEFEITRIRKGTYNAEQEKQKEQIAELTEKESPIDAPEPPAPIAQEIEAQDEEPCVLALLAGLEEVLTRQNKTRNSKAWRVAIQSINTTMRPLIHRGLKGIS